MDKILLRGKGTLECSRFGPRLLLLIISTQSQINLLPLPHSNCLPHFLEASEVRTPDDGRATPAPNLSLSR